MNKEDIAVAKRNNGYNCAQAVVCSYCEDFGLDERQMFMATETLGGGLGCTLGTCGALNAAAMIVSLSRSTGNLERPNSKGKTYPAAKQLVAAFEQEAGALRCRDIKGIDTGNVLCECEDCVRIACRLIDRFVPDAE